MPENRTWIEDAIRSAKARGMVPFALVLPVSPELMRENAGAAAIVGQMASDEIAKQVRVWQPADAGTEPADA